MLFHPDNYAYDAFKLAVRKLNANFPNSLTKGGLENHVEFRIVRALYKSEVLFKITADFDDQIKTAIYNAISDEAAKLRMTVLTVKY